MVQDVPWECLFWNEKGTDFLKIVSLFFLLSNMETMVHIKVIPRSSRSSITCDDNGLIKIHITSPPVDGKANSECIKVLSKKLSVAKSNIIITKGHKSRQKLLSIKDMTLDEIMSKITS